MSREFKHKILGLFGGLFSGDSGDFRGRGGEGGLKVSIPGVVGVTIKVIVVQGSCILIPWGLSSGNLSTPGV
ncbi:MAG: hypothetical protein OEW45_21465 [Deltaproteobacteria bacterium]|nr:hypothetical protein [Deltaproteobacteria bacterium]